MKFAHSDACVPYTWNVASSLAFGPADAQEGKKESARGGVSATAGIINNKGIGREIDGCTMTDVPSITSSLSSRRIDRVPPLHIPLVSILLSSSGLLFDSSPRRSTSLLSRSFLLPEVSLPSLSEERLPTAILTFLQFKLVRWLRHFRILLFDVHLLRTL